MNVISQHPILDPSGGFQLFLLKQLKNDPVKLLFNSDL